MTTSIDGHNWYISFDGTDISGQSNSCSLTGTMPENDITSFGSDWEEYSGDGVKGWSVSATVFHSEGASAPSDILEDAWFAGGTHEVILSPAGNNSGDKKYTGNAMVSEFGMEAGVGDGPIMVSVTLKGSGPLTPGTAA
jgi:hypothetical protein